MTHLLNDIYCVEVAEDAREHRINYEGNGTPHFMADLTGGYYHDIELPMGRWQFLFLSNQVTEERAREVVDMFVIRGAREIKIGDYTDSFVWRKYANETRSYIPYCLTALSSFQSLLKSKNLTGNQAIIQKNK